MELLFYIYCLFFKRSEKELRTKTDGVNEQKGHFVIPACVGVYLHNAGPERESFIAQASPFAYGFLQSVHD